MITPLRWDTGYTAPRKLSVDRAQFDRQFFAEVAFIVGRVVGW